MPTDENCDGKIDDADRRRLTATPEGLQQTGRRASPLNQEEIPATRWTKIGDGIMLDADNDGFPAREHGVAAAEIAPSFRSSRPTSSSTATDYDARNQSQQCR
jgi:hypothetical protein